MTWIVSGPVGLSYAAVIVKDLRSILRCAICVVKGLKSCPPGWLLRTGEAEETPILDRPFPAGEWFHPFVLRQWIPSFDRRTPGAAGPAYGRISVREMEMA
jgi:hypothetical protein